MMCFFCDLYNRKKLVCPWAIGFLSLVCLWGFMSVLSIALVMKRRCAVYFAGGNNGRYL